MILTENEADPFTTIWLISANFRSPIRSRDILGVASLLIVPTLDLTASDAF